MKRKKRTNQTAEKSSIKGEIIALLACVPFLLFGLALIFAGIKVVLDARPCTAETQGVVSSVSKTHTNKNGTHSRIAMYKATYSYELNGEELTDYFVTGKYMYRGKKITICYDPDDPEHKYVDWYENAGDVLIIIMGIVWEGFILLIVFCIINASRKKQVSKEKRDF